MDRYTEKEEEYISDFIKIYQYRSSNACQAPSLHTMRLLEITWYRAKKQHKNIKIFLLIFVRHLEKLKTTTIKEAWSKTEFEEALQESESDSSDSENSIQRRERRTPHWYSHQSSSEYESSGSLLDEEWSRRSMKNTDSFFHWWTSYIFDSFVKMFHFWISFIFEIKTSSLS